MAVGAALLGGDPLGDPGHQPVEVVDRQVAQHLHASSLRALYGSTKVKNAVHCTDLPEDGALEVDYFFSILGGGSA